jgi:hypothetical protein
VETEVTENAKRRRFTAEYKRKIRKRPVNPHIEGDHKLLESPEGCSAARLRGSVVRFDRGESALPQKAGVAPRRELSDLVRRVGRKTIEDVAQIGTCQQE